MVDNRGVTPISSFNFKAGDASGMANKMSEEKNGQGGEYFAQEMYEEEQEEKNNYQDRSAQLRASLDSLAMVNAGSMMFKKILKERERIKKEVEERLKNKKNNKQEESKEEAEEENLQDISSEE